MQNAVSFEDILVVKTSVVLDVFPIFSTVYRASVPVSGFSGQVRGQNFGPPSCKRSLDRDVAKTPKGPEQNAQNECPDAPEHTQLSYTETLIFFVF